MSKVFQALRLAGSAVPELGLRPVEAEEASGGLAKQIDGRKPGLEKRPPSPVRALSLDVSHYAPLLAPESVDLRAAEEYRIVRTKIAQHPAGPSMIVVSSPGTGDGKTVTAINLAAMLALKNDERVLLVDGDLRCSTVHSRLGTPQSPGLAEVLAHKSELEDALLQVAELPNLYILPAGEAEGAPTELLDSVGWSALTGRLREHFTRVIVDSPPIHSVADYELISEACDGVILVVRPDHTSRSLCLSALSKARKKLIGVLINGASDWFLWRQHSSSYYYRHGKDLKKSAKK
jgi:capsular exopolysaccharide synthesis family protein